MTEAVVATIITSIISGICVAVPSIYATIKTNNKNNALIEYKIQELTEKVERHNQVIDRVYKLEQHYAVEDKEISVINHRISDLEGGTKWKKN